MSEPALKCENNAIIKQIYILKLFIAFKMAYSCCFSLGGNLDFPEFLQKKFYNINYWVGVGSSSCRCRASQPTFVNKFQNGTK